MSLLAMVRAPGDAASLAAQAQHATAQVADAAVAVGAAEEHEEKLRHQLDSGPDPAIITAVLNHHGERAKVASRLTTLEQDLAEARKVHSAVDKKLKAAQQAATSAGDAVTASQQALLAAQTADRAAWMRRELVAGHACPVCEQKVTQVPPQPERPAMAAAKHALAKAEEEAEKARKQLERADFAWREADRKQTAAHALHDQLAARLAEIDAQLAGAESPEALRAQLKTLEAQRKELTEAAAAQRAAREAHRRAALESQKAEERLRKGWRDFDAMRDTVAVLAPPSADRDDLGRAWKAMATWAAEQTTAGEKQRGRLRKEHDSASGEVTRAMAVLDELFTDSGLARPKPGEHQRAAAVAVERASAARQRILQMQAQADTLRAQRAAVEADRQVASTLAQHLRANNFEAWLLQEALEALVGGASGILRELSSGQYDLIHDDREFFVVDHHDAGLRRAVRTLSGGETFQASLALALALADQLGGMSSNASLESIMLDEGFGTLDASTLDMVAATLENLAATGDRMVGVVTHVQSLAERIPVRFEITKDARSARVERIG